MSIQKWHYGKLILLWAWGGLIAGLVITDFMRPLSTGPVLHLIEFFIFVLILVALSIVTWCWLGGKES
jgi:hypothetical protein